jgi:hypothetical protein
MDPQAKVTKSTEPQEIHQELEEETPDIMPDRTLTAEEAEQDYQNQLKLLAEQEAEFNAQRSGGFPSNNGRITCMDSCRV